MQYSGNRLLSATSWRKLLASRLAKAAGNGWPAQYWLANTWRRRKITAIQYGAGSIRNGGSIFSKAAWLKATRLQ